MNSIFASRITPVGIRCKWCGKWHYGKSHVSDDLALKNAEMQIEKCRRTYEVMGWAPELDDTAEAPSHD